MSAKNEARHLLTGGGLGRKVPAKRGISVWIVGLRGEKRGWEIANGKNREAAVVVAVMVSARKWVARAKFGGCWIASFYSASARVLPLAVAGLRPRVLFIDFYPSPEMQNFEQ